MLNHVAKTLGRVSRPSTMSHYNWAGFMEATMSDKAELNKEVHLYILVILKCVQPRLTVTLHLLTFDLLVSQATCSSCTPA